MKIALNGLINNTQITKTATLRSAWLMTFYMLFILRDIAIKLNLPCARKTASASMKTLYAMRIVPNSSTKN